VSPWAYERIHRWNANAGRSESLDSRQAVRAAESAALCAAWWRRCRGRFLLHVDLARRRPTPTKANTARRSRARDGKPYEPGIIPDGFYLVDDSENPQPEFQRAIIEAVARVTHIAPADDKNEIIGSPVVAPGVIDYPLRSSDCARASRGARYTTTTEVYPDSPRADTRAVQCRPGGRGVLRDRVRIAVDRLTLTQHVFDVRHRKWLLQAGAQAVLAIVGHDQVR
jgi:hypothetical protein